jgi:hypothetical protein
MGDITELVQTTSAHSSALIRQSMEAFGGSAVDKHEIAQSIFTRIDWDHFTQAGFLEYSEVTEVSWIAFWLQFTSITWFTDSGPCLWCGFAVGGMAFAGAAAEDRQREPGLRGGRCGCDGVQFASCSSGFEA